MLAKQWVALIWLASILVGAIWGFADIRSPSRRSLIDTLQGTSSADQTRVERQSSESFWQRTTSDPAALFTALFTGVLAVSTIGLWMVTRRSLDHTEKEFIATHRPKLRVRRVEGVIEDGDGHEVCFVTVTNVGDSETFIEAVGHDLARRRSGIKGRAHQWIDPGLNASAWPIKPIRMGIGDRHVFDVRAARVITDADRYADAAGTQDICAVGEIRYRDRFGAYRETGFFRVYDPQSKSFIPIPEEEYED
jgi:hypothetical protein